MQCLWPLLLHSAFLSILDQLLNIQYECHLAIEHLSRATDASPTRCVPAQTAHQGFLMHLNTVDDQRVATIRFVVGFVHWPTSTVNVSPPDDRSAFSSRAIALAQ